MIETAIIEANKKGVKVMSLGLLNQACNYLFLCFAILTRDRLYT